MANMFIEAVNRIQNLTSGNKGAPAATGNTSDTTIAAAKAESKTSSSSSSSSSSKTSSSSSKTSSSSSKTSSSSSKTSSSSSKTSSSSSKSSTSGSNWRNSAEGVAISLGTATTEQKEAAINQGASASNVGYTPSSSSSSSSSTNWRNTEAGEAISLGTATDAQKVEALEQGATAQNVGFTNVDALPDGKYINSSGKLDDTTNLLKNATVEQTQTAADGSTITYQTSFDTLSEEQKAQYDTEAYADAVSRENIEKQTPKTEINSSISLGIPLDGSSRQYRNALQNEIALGKTITPGLRELAEEEQKQANRENLIYGNFYTLWETVLKNPDGSWNLGGPMQDNLFEQLEEWDAYDGSGEYRKAKAIAAAVELPTYFIGGGLAGGAAKAAQIGITKFGATKVGGKIVNVATSPLLKPASITNPKLTAVLEVTTTPTALAVNAGTVAYGVDVGSRIAAQPTTEKRLEQAAAIALKEIPFGAAGALKGFTATEKIADKISTIGKTEIPYKEIVAPGIPLGDYKPAQLQKSFEQNRLIPEPYKFARSENPRNYRGSVSLNPDRTDFIEAFHATGSGQYFGKRVTVAEGSSEVSGLWAAPQPVEHFLGDLDNTSPRFAILAREFGRSPQSKILDIRAEPKIKFLDWDKAAREAGYSRGQVMRDPELRKEVGDAYIDKYTEFGEAISPSLKNEYEAVFKPGTELKRLRRKYYTRAPSGKVIPIDEYKVTNKPNAPTNNTNQKEVESPLINLSRTELPKDGKYIRIEKLGLSNRGLLKSEYVNRDGNYIRIDTFEIISNVDGLPIVNKNIGVGKPKDSTTLLKRSYTGKNRIIEEHILNSSKTDSNTLKTPISSSPKPSRSTSSRSDRPQLPAFSAYRPARVEAVKIPSYTKTSGNSSIKTQLPASFSSSLPSESRAASPLSSRLSSAGPSSVKKGASSGISNKTGKSSASPYSYSGYKPGFAYPGDVKKKKEPRAKEPEYYTAARVGRIDRLSIVDPAEMIGRGSLTDRSRPARVFNREVLYITDGQIGTKKPKGRIRK